MAILWVITKKEQKMPLVQEVGCVAENIQMALDVYYTFCLSSCPCSDVEHYSPCVCNNSAQQQ
jgi:hypothetical protein